jgi:hypothetical protein
VDIDGTICSSLPGAYAQAIPNFERIAQINKLYETGNTIIYFTARGMGSNKNDTDAAKMRWLELTESQLEKWGAKYHELFLGKPAGDFYIDDKAVHSDEFFGETSL